MAMRDQAATARRVTSPSLAEKARELRDLFDFHAPANEAAGRLVEPVVKALIDSGIDRLWIPEVYGGAEATPLEGLETIEALCYADASTGWVLMAWQVAMASAAAFLPPAASQEVFGQSIPLIAGQGAPLGTAVPDGKGYRLTGRWRYGSGLLHCPWIHTGAMVVDKDGRPRKWPGTNLPEGRIFIVPTAKARVDEKSWDVLGLRGTGSIDYAIDDLYVPEEFTHRQSLVEAVPGQGGGLYRLGISGMGAICHTGFALGVARRILDELRELARADHPHSGMIVGRGGGESFQEQYGHAEARLRAARAFCIEAQGDIQRTILAGQPMTTRQITLARLSLNHVTSELAEITKFAYLYGGGVSLRNGVMQRCFRDSYTGTQHVTTQPGILRECGIELLGLYPDKVWQGRGLGDPN